MIIGPKYKICKRLGSGVFEKCQTQRFVLSEARRGRVQRGRRPRALSDYGKQLLEKQRIRYTYGLGERHLAKYVKEATSKSGSDPIGLLMAIIESRLDNVVYRLGLASTRRLARQIVSHGHITVGGKKITIPSYQVRAGEKVSVREGSRNRALFANIQDQLEKHQLPAWLVFDSKKLEGEMKSTPAIEGADLFFDVGEVLEFYTR